MKCSAMSRQPNTSLIKDEQRVASLTSEIRADLETLYASLEAEIAEANPRCEASGRCCRFKEYGHTLFLSQVEAELLLEPGLPDGAEVSDECCPYQVNRLCTARERRPLGCRIYFCDPGFQERQSELSERYLGKLKRLHEVWKRDWSYRPLRAFLDESVGNSSQETQTNPLRVIRDLP